MTIDYASLRGNFNTLNDAASQLSHAELRQETETIYAQIQGLIAECDDADVTFQPIDPAANDAEAGTDAEVNSAWTLGHVLVHLTATCEESAALGAEFARGVPFHGRSRVEVPWEGITTLAQLRQRLEESQRMVLAALAMWPDEPHLDNTAEAWPGGPVLDARGRHVLGLLHASDHLDQIGEIVRQSRAAKG